MNIAVLLHCICQGSELRGGSGVVTSQVARWLGVSKPTASKKLEKMVMDGVLERRVRHWRSNASVYLYVPSVSVLKMYKRGEFVGSYNLYMAEKIANAMRVE